MRRVALRPSSVVAVTFVVADVGQPKKKFLVLIGEKNVNNISNFFPILHHFSTLSILLSEKNIS